MPFDINAHLEGKEAHEKEIIKNSPRMRSIVNKDKKDKLYEEDLIDAYIAKYTKLVKQMAIDYKR